MAGIKEYITEGSRILFKGWKTRVFPEHYPGNAEEICRKVIKDCWNGKFFQTSTHNFPQFWTRDFGWCVNSLLKLGYTKEAHTTLRYALNRFKLANKVTTTITPAGKPFDFPTEAIDSLPWLIHSLKITKVPIYEYKGLLNKEINRFFEENIDNQTGLVRMDTHFSSIKDFAKRKSSCYDNCMVALMARDLKGMNLVNPLAEYNYPKLIEHNFWNGTYFYDDLTKGEYVAGDANIFPFVLGIVTDSDKLQSVIKKIQEAGLDQPFPLKYTADRIKVNFIHQEVFLRNYESDSIWTHMGPLYLKLLQKVDPAAAEQHKTKYKEVIERYGNYLEVFNIDGTPFKTPFYYCDHGMLWAANFLTL